MTISSRRAISLRCLANDPRRAVSPPAGASASSRQASSRLLDGAVERVELPGIVARRGEREHLQDSGTQARHRMVLRVNICEARVEIRPAAMTHVRVEAQHQVSVGMMLDRIYGRFAAHHGNRGIVDL